MKKLTYLFFTILLAILLTACGSEEPETEVEANDSTPSDVQESTDDDDASNASDEADEPDNTGGIFKVTEEDQLDLRIGDTGTVQTSIGTFELTIDSAEFVGTELDGEVSFMDELIVLDMTFKNIGDEVIIAEDIMLMMGITDDLEGSNNHNSAEGFESIDVFTGELEPGEERQTQFIADIYEADEYYFRVNQGSVANGSANQVIWTIPAE